MKKNTLLVLVLLLGAAFCMNLSCATKTPTAADNFQNPVTAIVAINPTFTLTFTATPSPTQTATITPTSTPSPTPYVVGTWSGFNGPSALAVDPQGNVYVAELGNNTVSKRAPNGTLVTGWGLKGKVPYAGPRGIAVDTGGKLFVVGNGNQVSEYDANGMAVTDAFSSVALSSPLAVSARGTTLVVADTGNQRVVLLDASGGLIASHGAGVSVFGAVMDSTGVVLASTGPVSTVVELSPSSLTIPGFNDPTGLAIDASDNLWVAETGGKSVEEFGHGALDQVPWAVFNNGGSLGNITAVAVDASGNIYVADPTNNTIVHFAP